MPCLLLNSMTAPAIPSSALKCGESNLQVSGELDLDIILRVLILSDFKEIFPS